MSSLYTDRIFSGTPSTIAAAHHRYPASITSRAACQCSRQFLPTEPSSNAIPIYARGINAFSARAIFRRSGVVSCGAAPVGIAFRIIWEGRDETPAWWERADGALAVCRWRMTVTVTNRELIDCCVCVWMYEYNCWIGYWCKKWERKGRWNSSSRRTMMVFVYRYFFQECI